MKNIILSSAAALALALTASAYAYATSAPTQVELNDKTFTQARELLREAFMQRSPLAGETVKEDKVYKAKAMFCNIFVEGHKTIGFSIDCKVGNRVTYKHTRGPTFRKWATLTTNGVADSFLQCSERDYTVTGFRQTCLGLTHGDAQPKAVTFTYDVQS